MKQLEVNYQPLFLVHYKNPWRDYKEMVRQSTLDNYRQYHVSAVVTVLEEINPSPIPVTVFLAKVTERRCYTKHEYVINSERELTDYDFQVLRSLGTFMNGQVNGKVLSHKKNEDGTYTYNLVSECDSGD
jgi:hypothetical protein